jgi:hypothetical protein
VKATFSVVLVALLLGPSDVGEIGMIRGTVRSGGTLRLLPMSKVLIFTAGSRLPVREIVTESGNFTIIGVPFGKYSGTASHDGFRSCSGPEVEVKSTSDAEFTFLLRPKSSPADSGSDVYVTPESDQFRMKFYKPEVHKYR